MKLSSHACCSRKAFTLIELLVVISIIGILAAILLPVTTRVTAAAQKVQAKNTEVQIVTAVRNFMTEYGEYPVPIDYVSNADICFGAQKPTAADLFHILRADNYKDEAKVNTKAIVYLELPNAKNQKLGESKNGIGSDGLLYDPWGRIYLIGVDTDYDGTLPNPYSKNAGPDRLRTGIIVYSWGPDRLTTSNFYCGGDKNVGTSADDVISWQ